jgi:hypothetical protein
MTCHAIAKPLQEHFVSLPQEEPRPAGFPRMRVIYRRCKQRHIAVLSGGVLRLHAEKRGESTRGQGDKTGSRQDISNRRGLSDEIHLYFPLPVCLKSNCSGPNEHRFVQLCL